MMKARSCSVVVAMAVGAIAVSGQSPDIHYVPTPTEVVDAMLAGVQVTANDVVYDLGSGDGRIVVTAAEKYGARGVGIEIDPALVRLARINAAAAGMADKVTFVEGDLFKTDLSEATVVTMYLSPSVNFRLKAKLQRELRPGARIASHQFMIEGWAAERSVDVGGRPVFFWTLPPRPAP